MQLTFLAASDRTRMAKRFIQSKKSIVSIPYPSAKYFWSFTRHAGDLEQLFALLVAHGEAGHCLLKGQLDRPLRHESRAGHTDPDAPTDLLVLDLDTDRGFVGIDAFLDSIGLGDVSFVLHHSSSAGITADVGLRAHLFVPLTKPIAPRQLKRWLQHLNLTVPALREQVRLSANGLTLRYPLDVTSCQNDKLLFIADPVVQGLVDPLAGFRFDLCERSRVSATLPVAPIDSGAVQLATDALVAELREQAGLPPRQARYIMLPGRERVLINPEPATVTGVRSARGFVYLNLNGGDSWAYYFPESNPDILYSFKGDPPVRLENVAPELWAQLRKHDPFTEVA